MYHLLILLLIIKAAIEIKILIPTNRITMKLASGSWREEKIASGSVCVSPNIFQAKVMVAPNSPRLLLKLKIKPAIIPCLLKGIIIFLRIFILLAPSVCAASIIFGSISEIDWRIDLTNRGKPITADAINAATHVKEIRILNIEKKISPTNPVFPKIINRKKPITTGGNTNGR